MPSALVSRFRNGTAPRLLARFANGGTEYVVRVLTPNPEPLLPPSETSTPVEFNAVGFGVSPAMATADPNLLVSDIKMICAAVDYVPVAGDFVRVNGKDRAILSVTPIPATGDPAAYAFYVR